MVGTARTRPQNMSSTDDIRNFSCTALFNKYDARKLTEIIGYERTTNILRGIKDTHMFVSNER